MKHPNAAIVFLSLGLCAVPIAIAGTATVHASHQDPERQAASPKDAPGTSSSKAIRAVRSAPIASSRAKSSRRTDTVLPDLLSAAVIGDAQLARERGGTDTHLDQNNSNGAVSGNVASQLTTGSNSISSSAFSNASGIPIVIQNSGNNVLIQNSTILNLQLTGPK